MTVTNTQHNQAIEYLLTHIPPGLLQEVHELEQSQGAGRLLDHLFGLGLQVRNTLREGGFTWDDIILDGEWAGLISEAARRYAENTGAQIE